MPKNKQQSAPKGEGDREADRRYREATERFVAEGDVEGAAEEARRAMEENPEELEEAEEKAKERGNEPIAEYDDRELFKRP